MPQPGKKLTQRTINDALKQLIEDDDHTAWNRIVELIRSGDVECFLRPNQVVLRVAPAETSRNFTGRLVALRRTAGSPTLDEIATELDVSTATISRLFNGNHIPWPTVAAVVAYLGGDPQQYRVDWRAARDDPEARRRF